MPKNPHAVALGDVRFVVHTIDRDDVRKAALKHGWSEDSEMGPNDYVEAEDYTKETLVASLEEGVEMCVKHIKSQRSYWGCEDVMKEEFHKTEWGEFEWQWTDHWIVSDEGVEEHSYNDQPTY